MQTEIDLNECEHFLSKRTEIDLNECEHGFLKANLDRFEDRSKFGSMLGVHEWSLSKPLEVFYFASAFLLKGPQAQQRTLLTVKYLSRHPWSFIRVIEQLACVAWGKWKLSDNDLHE